MSLTLRVAYASLFFATGLLALWAILRVRSVQNREVRQGLLALLGLSKLWVLTEVVRVGAGDGPLGQAAYVTGLVVGLAAVGAWLYFASAYAGRSFHRDRTVRAVAVVAYLLTVSVKLTNPLHGRYFEARTVAEPFEHLAITLFGPHWVVMTVSYLLAGYGVYLVARALSQSTDEVSLVVLLVLTAGLPGLLTLFGEFTTVLLPFNYEPVGAVAFAVGIQTVADGGLLSVDRVGRLQAFEELDQPVLITDETGEIREYNDAAVSLFPGVIRGEPDSDRLAELVERATDGDPVRIRRGDREQWYLVEISPLSVGAVTVGKAYVLTDVTDVEHHRQELERQNAQLAELNVAVRHELRNALATLYGYADLAEADLAAGDADRLGEDLRRFDEALDRMETTVEDLGTLTELGQTIDETSVCDLREVVERARERLPPDRAERVTVTVEGDTAPTVEANRSRLEKLFENLFRFAVGNGATHVQVTGTDGGFAVAGDGTPVAVEDPDRAFEFGGVVPDAEAGTLLPTARLLAAADGWRPRIDDGYDAGVRIVFEGMEEAADTTGREADTTDPDAVLGRTEHPGDDD
jgi:hypothetical protein